MQLAPSGRVDSNPGWLLSRQTIQRVENLIFERILG